MPSRRLPRSHVTRADVLRQASLKGNATPPADHAVPAALWAKLNLVPAGTPARLYLDALTAVDTAEQAASADTETVTTLLRAGLQLESHFFQVLDFAIARGLWSPSVRDYYGRDPHVDTLPDLTSVADALAWGEKIADGEAARTADGGAPMAMPSAAEVAVAIYNLNLALGPQTTSKDALTDAQQAVDLLLPGPAGIDKIILDLYNDVENHYRDLPPGARREKSREWGLLYDDTPGEAPSSSSTSSSSSSSSSGTPG